MYSYAPINNHNNIFINEIMIKLRFIRVHLIKIQITYYQTHSVPLHNCLNLIYF